jgi:hypothetical protein
VTSVPLELDLYVATWYQLCWIIYVKPDAIEVGVDRTRSSRTTANITCYRNLFQFCLLRANEEGASTGSGTRMRPTNRFGNINKLKVKRAIEILTSRINARIAFWYQSVGRHYFQINSVYDSRLMSTSKKSLKWPNTFNSILKFCLSNVVTSILKGIFYKKLAIFSWLLRTYGRIQAYTGSSSGQLQCEDYYSGMWRRVLQYIRTHDPKQHTFSIYTDDGRRSFLWNVSKDVPN